VFIPLNLHFKELSIISCWPMFISDNLPLEIFDKFFPRFPSKHFFLRREDRLIQEATVTITRYDWQQWK